jgi:hypothetical protein
MLIDTGSDITILKIYSLHDDVTIYCGEENKLQLAGISGKTTTIGETDCHINMNGKIVEHTIHIVPEYFQLQADGIIGIDLLNKLGASIHCKEKLIEIAKTDTTRNDEVRITTEHLHPNEESELLHLCNKYSDIFRKPGQPLSCTGTVRHEIPIAAGQMSINQKPYRLPEAQKPLVAQHIQEMQKNGIIRESTSPWNYQL